MDARNFGGQWRATTTGNWNGEMGLGETKEANRAADLNLRPQILAQQSKR